jgi:signal transduction histidine kinase
MHEPDEQRLLAFARRLQRAETFRDLLDESQAESQARLGYNRVWFMVADHEDPEELRLIEYSGAERELIWDVAPILRVKGDAFLEAVLRSEVPIVVVDARLDPRTNKELVERLGNRTIIKVPLRLLDKPFGLFGLGSFGDEGCRSPTPEQLNYLNGMVSQITVAANRLRYVEEKQRAQREREELERRFAQIQRIESLGLLAGGIAHDFNNLLTVIMACASLVEESVDEQALPVLKTIQDTAQRGAALTRQLLAMSRAQSLDVRPLNMNEQLEQLIGLMRRVLPESISIECIGGRDLPLTAADPSQIDQVFMNLLVNARDAMPTGGCITLETEQVLVNGKYTQSHPWAKQGRYVLVTVTDTGVGIPRDVQDRIFEPFFTTKGHRAGTGLGLAVAHGIVQQHGGMMHCYSEVGVGTSFKVYLPVAERLANAVGTKLQPPILRGDATILLAEDDEAIRRVVTRILEEAGYRVVAVADGSAACIAAAGKQFDLAILDVVMPGMPCRELVGRLSGENPLLRILLSSGYTAGASVAELMTEVNLDLLRKPYDPDQLLRAVQHSLAPGA